MPTTAKHQEKWKVIRQFMGSLCLANDIDEQVCTLLSKGQDSEDIRQYFNLTPERWEEITSADLFKRRYQYLISTDDRKQFKTSDEWNTYGLNRLRQISIKAKKDADKIKALAEICAASKQVKATTKLKPSSNSDDLSKLFGGKDAK